MEALQTWLDEPYAVTEDFADVWKLTKEERRLLLIALAVMRSGDKGCKTAVVSNLNVFYKQIELLGLVPEDMRSLLGRAVNDR